ncbi:outer membrane protein assembly factor BamD [Dongia sp.]|uniref:outer membrane protein assembly factor BamD n=1 Tax=Dongia sp. TaxID=1977262 RepID=UPI0035B3DF1C
MSIRIRSKSNAWRRSSSRFAGLALAAGLLVACSSNDEPQIPDTPVEVLYNNAKDALQSGEPTRAATLFDEVERQHPYSKWATQAQLMAAYSYYLTDSYDDAIPALERFIELHPGNRNAAYAFYLRALCYYEQIEDVTRDQGNTELAQRALSDVIARFPNTPYSRDATVKLDLVMDHLAGKEMDVGRYYLVRKQYLGAINRFKSVVERYQTTSHVPEALERLTESYVALGVFAEAQKTTAVLGYNYPGSSWYQDAYALLVSNGLTPEGTEAPPPIALVDPDAVVAPDVPPSTPALAPQDDIQPAPPAVPVDAVQGSPADVVTAPAPAPSEGGLSHDDGTLLQTNSPDDLMGEDPTIGGGDTDPSGEPLLTPGETPQWPQ